LYSFARGCKCILVLSERGRKVQVRELVRHILSSSVMVASVAPRMARGISLSAAWEIRAYESWQWCGSGDEDE
jgi:hypothetical protein